ncbi:hypothetical protein [Streptomyces sp. NPDC002990]
MTYIEDGLRVRNGLAEGPLADAALDRGARARRLMDELQERPETMTDAELRDGVSRALRYFMQRQPHADQVLRHRPAHPARGTRRVARGRPARLRLTSCPA